ncbi:MAG: nucleotide exchange factor GrpE [Lacisediminihabitans sp.]
MTDEKNNAEEIDPESGANAPGSGAPAAADSTDKLIEAEGPDIETSFTDADLAFLGGDAAEPDLATERLADLQRLQAEYVNYRKRVDRDREATREIVIAEVVKSLLPALDDLARAETHGDLAEGPMAVIAQKLRAGLDRFGLTVVGEKGEVFDPHLHEALVQLPSAEVTVNVVADVIEPGYMLGGRLLRPAKVAVSVPVDE